MPRTGQSRTPRTSINTATAAQAVAELVEELDKPTIGDAVLRFLRTQSLFDSALILMYRLRHRPMVLVDSLAHPMRSNDVNSYLAGAYLLDPVRMHAFTLRKAAVVRLRDITGEDFRSSEYFRTYYSASHVSDELNFLIPVAPEKVIAVCIERSQFLAPFASAEVQLFQDWLPLLSAVLKRHVRTSSFTAKRSSPTSPSESADREHNRLEARLAKFGSESLTPREHEVVQHLLSGASAPDIAGRLSVSLQTVRVHRRNIYEKLDVSSLGQLFNLALHAVLGEQN